MCGIPSVCQISHWEVSVCMKYHLYFKYHIGGYLYMWNTICMTNITLGSICMSGIPHVCQISHRELYVCVEYHPYVKFHIGKYLHVWNTTCMSNITREIPVHAWNIICMPLTELFHKDSCSIIKRSISIKLHLEHSTMCDSRTYLNNTYICFPKQNEKSNTIYAIPFRQHIFTTNYLPVL